MGQELKKYAIELQDEMLYSNSSLVLYYNGTVLSDEHLVNSAWGWVLVI